MLATWLIVGGLMLVCGIAMARMMWVMQGRPPLRKSGKTDEESDAGSDTPS